MAMTSFDKTCIFVCNKKSGCGSCGSAKLIKNLKSEIKNRGLKKEVKVLECSCLGLCKQGVATLTYPSNQLVTKLGPKDAEYLLNRIESPEKVKKKEKKKFKKKDVARALKVVEL